MGKKKRGNRHWGCTEAQAAGSVTCATATLSVKLLVEPKAQRVLYSEAGKDVVDFLISLLSLPLGKVAKLVADGAPMAGSVGNLYTSVKEIDDTYICLGSESADFYHCNTVTTSCRNYMTNVSGTTCPGCTSKMTTPVQLVEPDAVSVGSVVSSAAGAGFVQGLGAYTVMDDLKIAPMSTIAVITLLDTFGITDIGSLRERTVQLGYEEGLMMLKASLQSETVLTDVFIRKN